MTRQTNNPHHHPDKGGGNGGGNPPGRPLDQTTPPDIHTVHARDTIRVEVSERARVVEIRYEIPEPPLQPKPTDEINVLSGVILDYENEHGAAREATRILTPDDFADPFNRLLFEAIREIVADGAHPDALTISAWLEGNPGTPDGFEEALVGLVDAGASPSNVEYAARRLHEARASQRAAEMIARGMPPPEAARWYRERTATVDRRGAVNIYTLDDLADMPEVDWLILPPRADAPGILPEGGTAMIFGKSDHGKTFLALDMALAIQTGCAWWGHPVKQREVLYITGEGQRGLRTRVAAWREARGYNGPLGIRFIYDAQSLRDPAYVDAILERLEAWDTPPGLIVVDTVFRTFGGGNENSQQDMGEYIAGCDRIRTTTGGTILLLHHPGRENITRPRGSSTLDPACDTIMRVVGRKKGDALTGLKLHFTRNKEGALPPKIDFGVVAVAGSIALTLKEGGTRERIDNDVYECVKENPRRSRNYVESNVSGHAGDIRESIDSQLDEGFLVNLGTDDAPELVVDSYMDGEQGPEELPF